MIDLQIMQDSLMFLSVILLAAAPILSAIGTFGVGKVFFADKIRPRNVFVRRMFTSGVFVSLAGFFTSALCVGYVVSYLARENNPATFSGLLFVWILTGVILQPFINWRAIARMNGSVMRVEGNETQNQREDRQFGEQRRSLEDEHNKVLDNP